MLRLCDIAPGQGACVCGLATQGRMRRRLLELGLVAAGALVLVVVLMRRYAAISRSITQPIYALRERAQSIGRGDLAAREPVVAEDETLQALSSSIEQMAQHLQQQMELNRQEQDKLRAMELALLQSQINPHFLYNTLDTTKGIVLTNGNFNALAKQIIATNPMFRPGDRMLAAMPLFHGFGLGVCVL